MVSLESKIKGALYGFAIGDAMGATTEFINADQIKKEYGKVRYIMGGGWLNLEPGEVTDDTQMMLCVCDAIDYGFGVRHWASSTFSGHEEAMLTKCCYNFVDWLKTDPIDVGNCCRKVISSFVHSPSQDWNEWVKEAYNPESLGNGSLMRTLPIVLAGLSEDMAITQGRLTHNNDMCDIAIGLYYKNLEEILYHDSFRNVCDRIYEPTGHVLNTLNNALYWTQWGGNVENAIINAVNHGGDADTIAAITGSLAGALYGYEEIPQLWISQLSPDVKNKLDYYAKLFEKINKKVCTKV